MSTPWRARIALSVGDPNGIGPEIVLKALAALDSEERLQVTAFGPQAVLERAAAVTGLQPLLASLDLRPAGDVPPPAVQPSQVNAEAGASAVASATAAIEACRAGEFDAQGFHPGTRAGLRIAGWLGRLRLALGRSHRNLPKHLRCRPADLLSGFPALIALMTSLTRTDLICAGRSRHSVAAP